MARKKTISSIKLNLVAVLATTPKDFTTKQSWDNASGKFVSDDEEGKYSLTVLVNKDTLSGDKVSDGFTSLLKLAKKEQGAVKNIEFGGSAKYKCSILDGDDEEQFTTHQDYLKGNYVLTFKTAKDFAIVTGDGYKIKIGEFDEISDNFKAGDVIKIIGTIYYLGSGNIGVYGSLNGIKKKLDGTPLFGDNDVDVGDFDEDTDDEELDFYRDFINCDLGDDEEGDDNIEFDDDIGF